MMMSMGMAINTLLTTSCSYFWTIFGRIKLNVDGDERIEMALSYMDISLNAYSSTRAHRSKSLSLSLSPPF